MSIKRPRLETINQKSARLTILLELDNLGLLDGLSCQKIADLFGPQAPSRQTIFRDLKRLPAIRAEIHRAKKRIEILNDLATDGANQNRGEISR